MEERILSLIGQREVSAKELADELCRSYTLVSIKLRALYLEGLLEREAISIEGSKKPIFVYRKVNASIKLFKFSWLSSTGYKACIILHTSKIEAIRLFKSYTTAKKISLSYKLEVLEIESPALYEMVPL